MKATTGRLQFPALRALRRPAAIARGRIWALAAALALAALAAAYAVSPYWALRGLRTALRTGQSEAIAARVDLDAVRGSLKAQLAAMLERAVAGAPAPGSPRAVLGRVGPFVAQGLVAPLVDWITTPAGMAEFVERSGEPATELVDMVRGPAHPSQDGEAARLEPPPLEAWLDAVERQGFCGLARFCVELGSGWELELRARGLGWRVAQIRLPERLLER